MDFITYYQNISNKKEKQNLRNKVIERCKIQHSTFYAWIFRNKIPLLAQEKISEILGKDQLELFPVNEKIEC